jgi:hypothetical protein
VLCVVQNETGFVALGSQFQVPSKQILSTGPKTILWLFRLTSSLIAKAALSAVIETVI